MGKPGGAPPTKPAGTAIDVRRGERAVLTTPGERFELVKPLETEEARQVWDEYWEDPVSSVPTAADKGLLRRWIHGVDMYWQLMEEARREPVIFTASNGQLPNPLFKVALGLGNQIERIEIKLGIGPKNRLGLGLQVIEAGRALDEHTKRRGTPLPLTEEVDPRL